MASGGHMHNLTTLIKRLEAATSRLEDMAMSLDDPDAPKSVDAAAGAAIQPSAPAQPKAVAAAPAPSAPAASSPPQIDDFDALIKNEVQNFVNLGQSIGGLVGEQSRAVLQAFQAERTFIYASLKARKPSPYPPELMTDLHNASDTIDSLRMANRDSPYFGHLSAVAEGIVALGWFVQAKPADFVNEMIGSIEYYGNKVMKDYKDKDRTHVQYIQAYSQIFKSLAAYLKKHYAGGLTWNDKDGVDAQEALRQIKSGEGAGGPGGSGAGSAGTGMPPPPF